MNRRTSVAVVALSGLIAASSWAQDNGVIKGKVIFKGDTEKFKRQVLDTSKDPNCAKAKAKIGDWKVILNKKTDPVTVQNTLVYVKEGVAKKYPAPTEPVILDQIGCEYHPNTFGLMAGQPLKVRNSDATNHNIHFLPKKNEEANFSQPKQGMEKDITLTAEAPFKVKCDVHPWMGAYIGVFEHPFFATTAEDGTFELKGLPPGKYVVEAWHGEFGAQTATVEIASGETKSQDFTYEPK